MARRAIQWFAGVAAPPGAGRRVPVSVQNPSGSLGLKAGDAVRLTFGPDDCLCLRER